MQNVKFRGQEQRIEWEELKGLQTNAEDEVKEGEDVG